MNRNLLLAAAALTAAIAAAPPAAAQIRFIDPDFAVSDQWNNAANWDLFEIPDPDFDEVAIVGSPVLGAALTASVQTSGTIDSPSVILGDGGGTNGTLTIPTGVTFNVLSGLGAGDMIVGQNGGVGILNVTGGTLDVENALTSASGAPSSSINLSGSAQVTVANAFIDRGLRVVGSNVNFDATTPDSSNNGLILGAAGTHTWVIPAAGASTLRVAGNADLGGALRIEFDGVTPALGQTWNLIDAASVDANDATPTNFASVVTTADASLGPGARFAVNTVASGASVNGVFARLTLEQQPVLRVNRQTGQVTITNPGGVATAAIDAYSVGSNLGALDPQAFTGGFSQASGWYDANPTATAISELNPLGSGTVAASGSVSLGAVFDPAAPSTFGEENEDITFRYAKPGGGFIEGDVVYEGLPNNTLVLNVDPATGQTQLVNPTGFTVAIDAYTVLSESGSLLTSNTRWSSLQDQNADGGGWFEANAGPTQLAELLVDGGRTLGPDSVVSLGTPFSTTGRRDLEFQFALVASSDGDFNGDGLVNAADYTVWRDNLGAPDDSVLGGNGDGVDGVTQADYQVWADNYGATPGLGGELLTGKVVYGPVVAFGSSAAVPEPSTLLLAVFALVAGARKPRE
ncbi:hypothetical protein [Botrimarina sp.]|uniref:hypothetical protein n=1 Tax=Botrimarina sp. TaxID=2795802 RepID=UPI0032F01462